MMNFVNRKIIPLKGRYILKRIIYPKYFNLICFFILFSFILSLSALSYAEYISNNNMPEDSSLPFSDVPQSSFAYNAVHELRKSGITNGVGNNRFGYGMTLSRGEFVTFLVKLMDWNTVSPENGSFKDNMNKNKFYYATIETALSHGVITAGSSGLARPEAPITREEAAVMIVNCLGYGNLAERLDYLDKPFSDVAENTGYITIAKDFAIISGSDKFNPQGNILREQAAAMLIRMRDAMKRPLKDLNAFYAISSSSQREKIPELSSVCFGWSRLSPDPSSGGVVLNTSNKGLGYNEFYLPTGFSDRLTSAKEAGIPAMLMIYSSQDEKLKEPQTGKQIGVPEFVITNPEVYGKVISDIIASLKSLSKEDETGSFDGVAIDFEGLRGDMLSNSFNEFLQKLKTELDKENKKLYVAVHPLIHPKRSSSSIDGYDYRTIGRLADKIILMAHDYDAKKLTKAEMEAGSSITPLTPIEDIYYALQSITDRKSGVEDVNRIMLQLTFDWTVWQKKDGRTVNQIPLSFNLENFLKLLKNEKEINYFYAEEYENPYIKYIDSSTGYENTVWYENTESVMAKVRLARYFGISGISLWRLGLIPDEQSSDGQDFDMDVWHNLLNEME